MAECWKTEMKTSLAKAQSRKKRFRRFASIRSGGLVGTKEAFRINTFKWLGYYGYTGYVPGIPDEVREATDNSEVHWIIGTGDALSGEEHEQYNLAAQQFAEIYNRKRMELNK